MDKSVKTSKYVFSCKMGSMKPGHLCDRSEQKQWEKNITFIYVGGRLSSGGPLLRAISRKLWREPTGQRRHQPEADQGASWLQELPGPSLERITWLVSGLITHAFFGDVWVGKPSQMVRLFCPQWQFYKITLFWEEIPAYRLTRLLMWPTVVGVGCSE